jgi:hypothetical protein
MSAINLYTTKTEALYFKDSQRNKFYEFGGIQLLPNNSYTQKIATNFGNSYTVYVLKVADDSVIGNDIYAASDTIYAASDTIYTNSDTSSVFYSINDGNTVYAASNTVYSASNTIYAASDINSDTSSIFYMSITPNVDCYNDLIYLKFTNGTNTYYTNPFYITALDEDRTTKFSYKDLPSNNYESIGLKTWFRQKSRQSELNTYYESSTKNTVTQTIKTNNLEMYESEFMSIDDLILTSEILESPYLYIGSKRYSLFEAVKIPELTQQENFGKIKFTLAPNN